MNKIRDWYYYGGRIPRKMKKRILGIKTKKSVLKKMLNVVKRDM